jgi:hypothetical protein
MPVVVHLSNGQVDNLRMAKSCSWSPSAATQPGTPPQPRWLVCHGERGEIIATYKEASVNGFRVEQVQRSPRFRFPSWKKSVTAYVTPNKLM